MKKIIITKNGIQEIKSQIEDLNRRLKDIREEKNIAYHNSGDTWHDNPAFNGLEQEEKSVYAKIKELEKYLTKADIIELDNHKKDEVQIGSVVVCHCKYPKFEENIAYEIVGFGETDINYGKISYDTPVAKTLLGAKIGEELIINTPGWKVIYKVIKLFSTLDQANNYLKNLS